MAEKDLTPVPLSELPEINTPEGFWIFGSRSLSDGSYESGKYLFENILQYAKNIQLERRISLRMENESTDMFIGEHMTIYRVEAKNVSSLKINNQDVVTDTDISIEIAPKSIVSFDITFQLTDPVAYLFIYAKAILP